jgi:hypothetical protein
MHAAVSRTGASSHVCCVLASEVFSHSFFPIQGKQGGCKTVSALASVQNGFKKCFNVPFLRSTSQICTRIKKHQKHICFMASLLIFTLQSQEKLFCQTILSREVFFCRNYFLQKMKQKQDLFSFSFFAKSCTKGTLEKETRRKHCSSVKKNHV